MGGQEQVRDDSLACCGHLRVGTAERRGVLLSVPRAARQPGPAEQFDKLYADSETFVLENGSRTTPNRAIGCEILLAGESAPQRFLPTKAMVRFLDRLLHIVPQDAQNRELREELLDRRTFLKDLR
jgi:hypothetical protein